MTEPAPAPPMVSADRDTNGECLFLEPLGRNRRRKRRGITVPPSNHVPSSPKKRVLKDEFTIFRYL